MYVAVQTRLSEMGGALERRRSRRSKQRSGSIGAGRYGRVGEIELKYVCLRSAVASYLFGLLDGGIDYL